MVLHQDVVSPRIIKAFNTLEQRFIEKHKGVYTYDNVIYYNSKVKVLITCSEHGDFPQLPSEHLRGYGCKECGIISKRMSLENFLKKAKECHGTKYTYHHDSFKGSNSIIEYTCPVHGLISQMACDHLRNGGCEKCGREQSAKTQCKPQEQFVNEAILVHKDLYTYNKTRYINSGTEVTITCPKHGDFKQEARVHLEGSGCQDCAESGFRPNKPGVLYYLKVITEDNTVLYKIGITNNTVQKRFKSKDLEKIEVLYTKQYEIGKNAYNREQEILKKYKEFQYEGPKVLSSGNTELFTVDIREINQQIKESK